MIVTCSVSSLGIRFEKEDWAGDHQLIIVLGAGAFRSYHGYGPKHRGALTHDPRGRYEWDEARKGDLRVMDFLSITSVSQKRKPYRAYIRESAYALEN
jgi:hypothetical protein